MKEILKLALSNGPNRVGASHSTHTRPIWKNKVLVSETLCSLEYGMIDKVQKFSNSENNFSLIQTSYRQ
jgi:hypothetical protein